jgi:Ni,Fe-hydrogenase III small subunit
MYHLLKQIALVGIRTEAPPRPDEALRVLAQRLQEKVLAVFDGSLTIRHVDAGSCNGCELEIQTVDKEVGRLKAIYEEHSGLQDRFIT